jgi:hypothetical protein
MSNNCAAINGAITFDGWPRFNRFFMLTADLWAYTGGPPQAGRILGSRHLDDVTVTVMSSAW